MKDQHVLIVDDEQRTLMFLRESLVVAGLDAEFVCAPSAEEALQALAQNTFDVVILDIRLSGMDGLQMLRQLRLKHPTLRVILMSAFLDADTEAQARALGVFEFFRKPFALDEFTSAVASALRAAAQEADRAHVARGWDAQFIHRQLTALMRDTGAQSVVLTNGGGAVVARVGANNGLNEVLPVPVTSGETVFNFAYHQGKTHDVYSANVGNGIHLSLIFDRNQPGSRIGLVLQYTRRTVQDLAAALSTQAVQA